MGLIQNLMNDRIKTLGISNREAARQIGIAHTTLNRILDGDEYDLATLKRMADWLKVKPSSFLDGETSSPDQLVSQIAALLATYPRLAEIFSEVIARVLQEKISPDTFTDIAAYAAFRMNIAKEQKIMLDHFGSKEVKE